MNTKNIIHISSQRGFLILAKCFGLIFALVCITNNNHYHRPENYVITFPLTYFKIFLNHAFIHYNNLRTIF